MVATPRPGRWRDAAPCRRRPHILSVARAPAGGKKPQGRPSTGRPCSPNSVVGLLLEGVLGLLAGLLQVGLALLGLALVLHALVVGGGAELLLGLAQRALGGVLQLVLVAHGSSSDRDLVIPQFA